MQLSLCMIVRDEAFFIEECLGAARPHVDEIVVVDTGSIDGTREIARRYADKLIDFTWIDDFAAARNAGIAAADGDWILVLDADERIAAQDYSALRAALENSACDGYYLTTRNYMDRRSGSWQPVAESDVMSRGFSGYTTHRIMKCFRRRDDIRYRGRVHEIVDETIDESARCELPVIIHHYGDANEDKPRRERALRYLAIMEEELAEREDARLLAIAASSALHFAEDYPRAARYFRRAAELGYQRRESLEGAAEAHYRAGEPGPALDLYIQAYAMGPRSPALCLNMANLYVRTGDKGRGAELLRECLQLGGIDEQTNEVIRRNLEVLAS